MSEHIDLDTLRLDLNGAILDAKSLRDRDAPNSISSPMVAGDLLRRMDALVAVVRTQVTKRSTLLHSGSGSDDYKRSTADAHAALVPFLGNRTSPPAHVENCHAPIEEMREAIRQCWYWFDDHDDRKTSAELHDMLRRVVGA